MKIITPPVRLIIDIAIVCICIFFVLFKELLPVVRVLQVSPEAEAADWVVLGLRFSISAKPRKQPRQ